MFVFIGTGTNVYRCTVSDSHHHFKVNYKFFLWFDILHINDFEDLVTHP